MLKLCKKIDNKKTDKTKKSNHFKVPDFKIGQIIAIRNHLRNTFES